MASGCSYKLWGRDSLRLTFEFETMKSQKIFDVFNLSWSKLKPNESNWSASKTFLRSSLRISIFEWDQQNLFDIPDFKYVTQQKNIDYDDSYVWGFGSTVILLINLIHWSRISFIIFHVCGLAATKAKNRKMQNIIFLSKTFPLTLIHYQYFALY